MKIKIGSHVSNNGTDMLLGSVKEALSYNANSFMVYLGAPQNSFRKPLSQLKIEEYKQVLLENNIDNLTEVLSRLLNNNNNNCGCNRRLDRY